MTGNCRKPSLAFYITRNLPGNFSFGIPLGIKFPQFPKKDYPQNILKFCQRLHKARIRERNTAVVVTSSHSSTPLANSTVQDGRTESRADKGEAVSPSLSSCPTNTRKSPLPSPPSSSRAAHFANAFKDNPGRGPDRKTRSGSMPRTSQSGPDLKRTTGTVSRRSR